MSAHCDDCGYDLPYEGDCSYCALRVKLDRIEKWARDNKDRGEFPDYEGGYGSAADDCFALLSKGEE